MYIYICSGQHPHHSRPTISRSLRIWANTCVSVHQGVAVWCSVLQLVADIFKMPSFHYITAKEPYTYLQRSSVYIQKNPIQIHKGALYTHQRALYISLKNPYRHPQRSPIHPQPTYLRKEPYIAAKEPYGAHLTWNAGSHEHNTLAAHYTPPQKSLRSLLNRSILLQKSPGSPPKSPISPSKCQIIPQ